MRKDQKKGDMTTAEAGRRGGRANAAKYDHEHFVKLGKKGGAANAARHDHEHFVEIGRKAGARTRELIAAGKRALGED